MSGTASELDQLHPPATPAIGMASADRCPNCGAELTPDQRYCVECGTRRGGPRFGLERGGADARNDPAATPAPQPSLVRRLSSGTTLLTGLAVLLLALGVGVMIGRSNNSSLAGKPAYKIYVNGGSGGSTTGGGSSASGSGGPKSSGSKSSGSKSSGSKSGGSGASIGGKNGPTVNQSSLHTKAQRRAAVKKLTNTKVKLNNGKTLAPASQKLGGKCSNNTVGCTNGKFNGQFFGGG